MMDLAESSFTFTFPSSQFITTLSPSTRLPLLHTRVEIFPLPFFFFIFPSPSRASLSLHYVFGPSFLPTPSDHLLPSPAFIQPVPFNPARPDSRHPAFRPHPAYRATRIPQSWSPTCSLQSDDRPSLCPLTQGMFIHIPHRPAQLPILRLLPRWLAMHVKQHRASIANKALDPRLLWPFRASTMW